MKFLFTLLLCISIHAWGSAQSTQDLEKQLLSTPKNEKYVDIINELSWNYFNSNPEKSDQLSLRALSLADSLHYQKGLADAYYGRSLVDQLDGDYAEELKFLLKSAQIYEALRDDLSMAKIYGSISVIHYNQRDFTNSKSYLNKARELYKKRNDLEGEATILRRMGNIEADMHHSDNALKYYQSSLVLEEKIDHKMGIANSLNNIGIVYYELGKYTEALIYYNRSLAITEKINNLYRLPAAYHNIGRVYLRQHNPDKAISFGNKALEVSTKLNLKPAMLEATLLLSEAYDQKKQYNLSLLYLKEYKILRDSLQETENGVRISQLESLLTKERQEQRIIVLQKEKEAASMRQWILIGGVLMFFFVGTFIVYYQYQNFKKKAELTKKQEELKLAQASLLKAESEAHREKLARDLEFKNKELMIYTLNMTQKNMIMEDIRAGITEVLATTSSRTSPKLAKLTKLIDYSLDLDKDWDAFKTYFDQAHTDFFAKLSTRFPDLTLNDHKICALISLNLTNKELGELLGISPESAKMARYRIKKKMDILSDENLIDFLLSIK